MNKPYPAYVDLSLFNFPDHIDPQILLNLEIDLPVELEPGLTVIRGDDAYDSICCTYFYYTKGRYNIDHNPYGPSSLWNTGTKIYKINGIRHRLAGPAIMNSNGVRFYVNGTYYKSELEYWIAVEKYKQENPNG